MHSTVTVALKALLVVMILIMLAGQIWVIPGAAAQTAMQHPEYAHLQLPGILITITFLLCVQLALVCVWRLLSLVRASSIFSPDAFKWVDVILALVIAATLLILISFITLTAVGVSSPANVLCILGVILGSGFALLVVVLRGLLRKASQLEQDLAEVV
jgi:hypothetical protein